MSNFLISISKIGKLNLALRQILKPVLTEKHKNGKKYW